MFAYLPGSRQWPSEVCLWILTQLAKSEKCVSNPGSVRIILDRNRRPFGILENVANEINQQDRSGISSGDAHVWRKFLGRQMPRLYGMFVKRWPNPSLAEELVQKTAFDAVRGRATYDYSKGSPEEWLFGIARNNIRLEIRKRATMPTVNGDVSTYLSRIDTEPLPHEVLERQETVRIVRAALDRLASNERRVLEAKYIEGLSARGIAQQMNTTEKAIHSLLYRARISFREQVERIAGDTQGSDYGV